MPDEPKIDNRVIDLIPKLQGDDCFIEQIESGIRVSFYDGQAFDIFEVGGWVQVGAVVLSEDELDDLTYREELYEFVLGLNSRCLGCRFSLEPYGSLLLVDDIPIDRLNVQKVNEAIENIAYVDFVFFDLIVEIGKNGIAPTEEEIDEVVTEKEGTNERYH
jgi:hypothetical protein